MRFRSPQAPLGARPTPKALIATLIRDLLDVQ
jgi:hypothetical protein